MNSQQATAYIVKEIAKHHDRNELIKKLCRSMGLHWQEAERLVQRIENEHGHAIAARQSPTLIAFSLAFFIGGIYLLVYGVQYFMQFSQMATFEQLLNAQTGYIRAGSLVTGAGMVLGSLVGLWKTVAALLQD